MSQYMIECKGTKREAMQPTSLKCAIKTEFSKQYYCHKENITIQQVKYLSLKFHKMKMSDDLFISNA